MRRWMRWLRRLGVRGYRCSVSLAGWLAVRGARWWAVLPAGRVLAPLRGAFTSFVSQRTGSDGLPARLSLSPASMQANPGFLSPLSAADGPAGSTAHRRPASCFACVHAGGSGFFSSFSVAYDLKGRTTYCRPTSCFVCFHAGESWFFLSAQLCDVVFYL